MNWNNLSTISSKNYVCGHCGSNISSNLGYFASNCAPTPYIYICHSCKKPTYFYCNEQVPGAAFGKSFNEEIFNGDKIIFQLYDEARNNMKLNAFTSVGLCCRKLLMHIAVNCGAKENLKFVEYVDYLDKNNYIPINAKLWVDKIRDKGNEATHEIKLLNSEEAKTLLSFIEILITMIYEMPYRANNI